MSWGDNRLDERSRSPETSSLSCLLHGGVHKERDLQHHIMTSFRQTGRDLIDNNGACSAPSPIRIDWA